MATLSGKPGLSVAAWSASARNSQLSPSRTIEMTRPSGPSAWTFNSARAMAMSSASVLAGLLIFLSRHEGASGCRLERHLSRGPEVAGFLPRHLDLPHDRDRGQ